MTKRAFYDLQVSPYSFDFAQFLIAARAADCAEIVIVPGDRAYQKCTPAEQEYRLRNLLLGLAPAATVCGSRDEAALLAESASGVFPEGYSVAAPKAAHMLGDVMRGGKIFPFLPTDEAKAALAADGWPRENLVAITMRNTHIKPERNSTRAEWIKAANWMRKNGLAPVFVPDTEHPDEAFGDHPVCARAALDVAYRIALYEAAALNVGVNNGPMALNLLSRRPVLYFRPINAAYPETSESMWTKNCLAKHTQPPWFTPLQRIIWDGIDTVDNIIEAVKTWQRARAGDATAWPLSVAPIFPIKGVRGAEERGAQMAAALEAARANGWRQMVRKKHGPDLLSVVCYGPSLADTWQHIKRPILTVSGAHDFLVERGVVPDYHMDCDPREHKADLVQKLQPGTLYCMATVVHPVWWTKLAGHRVALWHLHNGDETDAWLAANDPGANRLGGGTTAGARALEVGSMLGYRRFELHGMDCSFRGDVRHAGRHGGKKHNEIAVWCNGREFVSSPQMIEAGREMITFISNYDAELFFHGDGLQQEMVRAFRNRFGVIPTPLDVKQEAA